MKKEENFSCLEMDDLLALDAFFSHWHKVHAETLALLDKFSDDELAYVAYEGGMPVGQIALHIAAWDVPTSLSL